MRHLTRVTGRRLNRLIAACVLLTAGIGAAVLLQAGTAQAAVCGPAAPTTTNCTMQGTFTFAAGSLTLSAPAAVSWSATSNGLDQHLFDPATADQFYVVDDAQGGGAGWHVTLSATTFTVAAKTLPDIGTLSTNGSVGSFSATTAPTAACVGGSTCTLPTDTTTYPVAVTTAATTPTAVTIYDTSINTGLGSINIGFPGANAIGWWLFIPARTLLGVYLSTMTMTIVSAP